MKKFVYIVFFIFFNLKSNAQYKVTQMLKSQKIIDHVSEGNSPRKVDFSQSFDLGSDKNKDSFSIVSSIPAEPGDEMFRRCTLTILDNKYSYLKDEETMNETRPSRSIWYTFHAYDAFNENCYKLNAISFIQIKPDERPIILYSTMSDEKEPPHYRILCYNGLKYRTFFNSKIGKIRHENKNFMEYKHQLNKYFTSINFKNKYYCK